MPALRWFLIILLPLTIGWKVAADRKPPYTSKDVIVDFLTRHNFDVVVTDQMIGTNFPLIDATAGACRMFITEVAPGGWNREAINEHARTMDQLFIVERGKIHGQQLTWLDVTEYWWSKYLRKLGISGDEIPLISVAATGSCNAEQLPWTELNNPVLSEKSPYN